LEQRGTKNMVKIRIATVEGASMIAQLHAKSWQQRLRLCSKRRFEANIQNPESPKANDGRTYQKNLKPLSFSYLCARLLTTFEYGTR